MGNLFLYICSTFQNNTCDGILKNIVSCNVLTPTWASKQMDIQIINVHIVKNVQLQVVTSQGEYVLL